MVGAGTQRFAPPERRPCVALLPRYYVEEVGAAAGAPAMRGPMSAHARARSAEGGGWPRPDQLRGCRARARARVLLMTPLPRRGYSRISLGLARRGQRPAPRLSQDVLWRR